MPPYPPFKLAYQQYEGRLSMESCIKDKIIICPGANMNFGTWVIEKKVDGKTGCCCGLSIDLQGGSPGLAGAIIIHLWNGLLKESFSLPADSCQTVFPQLFLQEKSRILQQLNPNVI